MYTVIFLVVMVAIGWVVSKSRILSGTLDVIGRALQILWGVGLIVLSVWELLAGVIGLWGIVGIGFGIYFLWPNRSRLDRAVHEVAEALPTSTHAESGATEDAHRVGDRRSGSGEHTSGPTDQDLR